MKKIFWGLALAAGMASLAVSAAGAQTISPAPSQQPMVLQVGPAGKVLIRGNVVSIASGSIVLKSWGGDWTVNTPSGSEILPSAAAGDLTKFQAGDYVGVQGTISTNAPWTINASIVRDWTMRQVTATQQRQNQQSVKQLMTSETPKVYVGTASNVAASSLTLTATNGTSYSVNIATDAKILNRNWLSASVSSIANGDTVRVFGTNANGTITASVVRDITIPTAGR